MERANLQGPLHIQEEFHSAPRFVNQSVMTSAPSPHHCVQLLPLQQDRVLHKKGGSVLININIHVMVIKPSHIPFEALNVNAYFNTLSLPPS